MERLFSSSSWVVTTTRIFLLLAISHIALSQWNVTELPGFSGELPFSLETGYIGVGDSEEVQLFYYFIESQQDPVRDPLMLWLTGGPGCSGFSGLVYEMGPLSFDVEAFNGSFPTLMLNQYSWTKVANIIFIDSPVGTGFSYSTTYDGYSSMDTEAAEDLYEFIRKWLIAHPSFIKNPLYIGGDSYGGKWVPMVVEKIAVGNLEEQNITLNLQGYLVGNPLTNEVGDSNAIIKYAHRMGLLPDELYESAKVSCDGNYNASIESLSKQCTNDIIHIKENIARVNDAQILEPKCAFASPYPDDPKRRLQFYDDTSVDLLQLKTRNRWCRNHNYVLSYIWANDPYVQEALHVRNGTIKEWQRCNKSIDYTHDIVTVVDYHLNISRNTGLRALVYSGDHDMLIPFLGTRQWVLYLNLTVVDRWRPWFVDGQVAGYTEKYMLTEGYRLTFITIKGSGHTAPEYTPKECFEMIDRWFSYYII